MPVIAVDCGGTNLSVARLDRATDPGEAVTVPTPDDPGDFVPLIGEVARGLGPGDAAGVSIAGLVADGDLVWMPHRDGGAPIATPLSEVLGCPVVVDNDANTAAVAEALAGAGRGHRMVLMITVGTGIGAGLVVDGVVERGRGHLGEVGHMTIVEEGQNCSCGKAGCWEALASGTALDRAARELARLDGSVVRAAGAAQATGHDLVAAAGRGDDAAQDALRDVAVHFGRGLANMVAVFDPDVIVIGGGVGSIGEPFLGPARHEMESRLSGGDHRQPTPVVPGAFGVRAGLVGAGILAGAPV
jgi:glucokinase